MTQLYAAAECKPYHQEQMARGGVKTLISKGKWQGLPFYVIGPYDTEGTGGCDRISQIADVIKLVDDCAKRTQAKDAAGILASSLSRDLPLAHSWGQRASFFTRSTGPGMSTPFSIRR